MARAASSIRALIAQETKKAPVPSGNSDRGQSPADATTGNNSESNSQKGITVNNIIPQDGASIKAEEEQVLNSDRYKRELVAARAERARLADRITTILAYPFGRADIVEAARLALDTAIESGLNPDDLGDLTGFTLGQFEWYLSDEGENATAEVVEAALRVAGGDVHVACAVAEAAQADLEVKFGEALLEELFPNKPEPDTFTAEHDEPIHYQLVGEVPTHRESRDDNPNLAVGMGLTHGAGHVAFIDVVVSGEGERLDRFEVQAKDLPEFVAHVAEAHRLVAHNVRLSEEQGR